MRQVRLHSFRINAKNFPAESEKFSPLGIPDFCPRDRRTLQQIPAHNREAIDNTKT
jgi:hypothetical protein